MKKLYLTLTGIPTEDPSSLSNFFLRDPQGFWYPNNGYHLTEIDNKCVILHDQLASKIFGSLTNFYEFLQICPEFLHTAGMNSEAPISKDLFGKFIEKLAHSSEVINKALYLFDCRKLVTGIQECSKEVLQLQGEFYQSFNLEELFFPPIKEDDGIRYVTSPVVIKINALLGFIYIRLHSLLDYATQLTIEIEKLKIKFDTYPRLSSKNSLYSDRKKLSFNNKKGSLFENCFLITEIESVRNHLIHNGLMDDMPKIYKVISNGECIEKFILFPDQDSEGRFEAFKNRNLFYGKENKINLRLPDLIADFQTRMLFTLDLLIESITTSVKSE